MVRICRPRSDLMYCLRDKEIANGELKMSKLETKGEIVEVPDYLFKAHAMVRNYVGIDHQIIDFQTRQPIEPGSGIVSPMDRWRFLSHSDLMVVWTAISGIFRSRPPKNQLNLADSENELTRKFISRLKRQRGDTK